MCHDCILGGWTTQFIPKTKKIHKRKSNGKLKKTLTHTGKKFLEKQFGFENKIEFENSGHP